ncbi:MAG TPA: DUF6350 family protein [Actinophytocola sp.]|uniref:cell division protein PerM n=1 Tax=Actinophytocola sp. TaxID=1872138 RepID=UPI002DBFA7AF|nr:DUF6350 family protein [Actinophytocola sp.]HEU5473937.1 DUF6350 family protein [Actinophytocola sp.]
MALLRSAPPGETLHRDRVRVLGTAALEPLVAGYAAVTVVLAVVTSMAAGARFGNAGVLAAAAPGWFAVYQVPLEIKGHELGALPLLPTVAAILLIARTAAAAIAQFDLPTPRDRGQVVVTIAGAHAVFAVLLWFVAAAGPVGVDPLAAVGCPVLLAAGAALAGVAWAGGLAGSALGRLDPAAGYGVRLGVLATGVLLAGGAFVLVVGLVASLPAAVEMLARTGNGLGGMAGLLLLSAGYLPNGVIAATSFVAGPGFSIGVISVGSLNFSGGGAVPPLPLLAALPDRPVPWGPLLLAVPIGAGVLIGRRVWDLAGSTRDRLRAVAAATGVVVLCLAVLAVVAGGALGGGRFDPVDLHAASLGVAVIAEVGLAAAVVAALGGLRDSEPGPADRKPLTEDLAAEVD